MSGISAYYYIGNAGGFLGSDGLNGIDFTIAVWEADRRTLTVDYQSDRYVPLSQNLRSFVPAGPCDSEQARRAMLLFASNLFAECPSYQMVKDECGLIESMDFSTGRNVPPHFNDLLEESKQIDLDGKVHIFFAPLRDVAL